jgi:hypothetical protein
MLDRQNQGPPCAACGSPMRLSAIEPSSTGHDLRTFTCQSCERVEVHVIARELTEAWPRPERAIQVRRESAVSHEVHGGRMIPKQGC